MPSASLLRRALGVALALACVVPSSAFALRVMAYNTLNYPGNTGFARADDFRAVIAAISPDLILCQEIGGASGAAAYYNNVLNTLAPGEWTAATFTEGPDSDNAMYFRAAVVTEVSHGVVFDNTREVDWWQVRLVGRSGPGTDVVVYGAHLKASTGSDNEAKRAATAAAVRDHMQAWPAGTHFLIGGDFNLYDSFEPAYQEFLESQANNEGRLFDPIDTPGVWHNNASFAPVHTQSTRTTSLGDGGATGGCDDRFDFLLVSDDLLDGVGFSYVDGSYTAFGQDGQHFNININDSPTNTVGQALANNLQAASDHLPVYMDLQVPALAGALPTLLAFTMVEGGTQALSFDIENLAALPADGLDWSLQTLGGPTVVGSDTGTVPAASLQTVSVQYNGSSAGQFNGSVAVQTDDPEATLEVIPATMSVLRAAEPSFDAVTAVVGTQADFGTQEPGSFANQFVSVYNPGPDALQSGLSLVSATVSGPDAARFAAGSLGSGLLVSGQSRSVELLFDDTGAVDGSYSATITIATSDDPSLDGAQSRSDLVIDVQAIVDSGATPAPALARTFLHPVSPNPFNPATTVRFELARAGAVSLDVLDLRGRVVRTLTRENWPAGRHSLVWRGDDHAGRAVSSGVYLLRLRADRQIQLQRAVLVR